MKHSSWKNEYPYTYITRVASNILLRVKSYIVIQILVIFLIAALAILEIYAVLGLYADGSFFLVNILKSKYFFDFYKARCFSQLITQVPIVFAIKIGIDNLNILIRLHSFGLIAVPVGFWISALIMQIKTDLFWIFVTAFSICYLSSAFFAIGEYNLPYSMTAFISALLLRERIGLTGRLALLFSSFGIILTYETMVFLGPLLFAICIFRFVVEDEKHVCLSKVETSLCSIFFWVSAIISLLSILSPGPGHAAGAFSDFLLMMMSPHFVYLLLMVFLYITSLFIAKKLCLLLAGAISIAHVINISFWSFPEMNYRFRLLSGVMLFFLMGFSALYYFLQRIDVIICKKQLNQISVTCFFSFLKKCREIIFKMRQIKPSSMAMLLFISSIIPFFIQTVDFYYWGKAYEQEIRTRTGFVPIQNTKIAHSPYNWFWTNASLSMVLRGNHSGAIIINGTNYSDIQPIDPYGTGLAFDQTDDAIVNFFKMKAPFYHHWNIVSNSLFSFLTFNYAMRGVERPNGNLPGA